MKKEWLLLLGSVTVTLLLALGLIRWYAPQLLGIPPDMQVVQVSEELPPFYEGIFRNTDNEKKDYGFILKDPITTVRALPFYPINGGFGPHDIIGFRNHFVPVMADVVTIGDSQTYGNNAPQTANWPSIMGKKIALTFKKDALTYSMATGGWGGVQYLDMATKAMSFKPLAIAVAYYTGNDSLETFRDAYKIEQWHDLILDRSLSIKDMPANMSAQARQSDLWQVTFSDGTTTVFTPAHRHQSNNDHPAVIAGYSIMAESARRIASIAEQNNVKAVFTIIPTKELVFKNKVTQENLQSSSYSALIKDEEAHIEKLRNAIQNIEYAEYVDIITPLQDAALKPIALYPTSADGHPLQGGYSLIGETIAHAVEKYLSPSLKPGLNNLELSNGNLIPILVFENGWVNFFSDEVAEGNGWFTKDNKGSIPKALERSVSSLDYLGTINTIDPAKYGPQALLPKIN